MHPKTRSSNLTSNSNPSASNTNYQASNANNLIYNLPENVNSRSMCAVVADDQRHRFVVGTCSVNKPNQLHLL